MAKTLTGKIIAESYKGLLIISDNNQELDTNLVVVTDGAGNETPLKISTNKVKVTAVPSEADDVARLGDLNDAGIPEAPITGEAYVRQSQTWQENEGKNTAFDNTVAELPDDPQTSQAAIESLKSYVDDSVSGTSRYRGVAENGLDLRTLVPYLRGDYFVVPAGVNLTFDDGAGNPDIRFFENAGNLYINEDMPLATDVIVSDTSFNEVAQVEEAPQDGVEYVREDGDWKGINRNPIFVPFSDPDASTIKFDHPAGYQHGIHEFPLPDTTFSMDFGSALASLGAMIVSNAATKPTYDGGAAVTVEEIGGEFIAGQVNVIRIQFIGNGRIQVAYDQPVKSAVLDSNTSSVFEPSEAENGKTITLDTGSNTVQLNQGVRAGVQVAFFNRTAGSISFVDDGTSVIESDGTELSPSAWAYAVSLGSDIWALGGKLA